jgi:hypothetical protein
MPSYHHFLRVVDLEDTVAIAYELNTRPHCLHLQIQQFVP